MTDDYHVPSGHSLYSVDRFRDDVHHMIIYEDLDPEPTNPYKRTRLFLDDEAYQTALRMEKKGWICILVDAEIIEGHIIKRKEKEHA